MAPSRGRGRSFGARGTRKVNDKLARKGIRTRNGYKRFDSQRILDAPQSHSEDEDSSPADDNLSEQEDLEEDKPQEETKPAVKAYYTLLESFQPTPEDVRPSKRRKVKEAVETGFVEHDDLASEDYQSEKVDEGSVVSSEDSENQDLDHDDDDKVEPSVSDPYDAHFVISEEDVISNKIKAVDSSDWKISKQAVNQSTIMTIFIPNDARSDSTGRPSELRMSKIPLKQRLVKYAERHSLDRSEIGRISLANLFDYSDLLLGNRTTRNAADFRQVVCLHTVNHLLKGRDKVLKNNERLKDIPESSDLDCRDQGFVRPKVLILLETRQTASKYVDQIAEVFEPQQQENIKRFEDAFTGPIADQEYIPEDFKELFDGNNDNVFMVGLKFTRKTIKLYSGFYNSDLIIASPLGLRRIVESEDPKKRDYDFLSSIELVIADQADAMQMQSWENVEIVFKHLNLILTQTHGCDFSRVKQWYLDGHARYLRQTVISSAYITPEMNSLFNSHMLNIAGKVKITPHYEGAINETTGLGFKQIFSRFASVTPSDDADARFKYFTSAILPNILRLPPPSNGAQGVLIFIPSYFDFLRVRNFFATSTQTQNLSFGAIHDYSDVSDQRRARSHFLSGRHSILLYTQRAHHFFRLKIRGVKKIFLYGLPDNPIFYQEFVQGFLGTTITEGRVEPEEVSVRGAFSKWDGLKLERIVGSQRIKGMLGGVGDTFEFL